MGEHRRSLGETACFRLKPVFGDRLSARNGTRQPIEAAMLWLAFNRMIWLGMLDADAVPACYYHDSTGTRCPVGCP
jgi:hypothetical protein